MDTSSSHGSLESFPTSFGWFQGFQGWVGTLNLQIEMCFFRVSLETVAVLRGHSDCSITAWTPHLHLFFVNSSDLLETCCFVWFGCCFQKESWTVWSFRVPKVVKMTNSLLKSFSASEHGVWMPGGNGDYWAHGCLTHTSVSFASSQTALIWKTFRSNPKSAVVCVSRS